MKKYRMVRPWEEGGGELKQGEGSSAILKGCVRYN